MLPHIDEFGSTAHRLKRCIANGFRFTHKGDNGAVGGLAWVHVEKFHTTTAGNHLRNGINSCSVAALAEIGDALNDSFSLLHSIKWGCS